MLSSSFVKRVVPDLFRYENNAISTSSGDDSHILRSALKKASGEISVYPFPFSFLHFPRLAVL